MSAIFTAIPTFQTEKN